MTTAFRTPGIIRRIYSNVGVKVMKDLPEEDIRKLYFELKDLFFKRVADLLGKDRDCIKEFMLDAYFVNDGDILFAYENRTTIPETFRKINSSAV